MKSTVCEQDRLHDSATLPDLPGKTILVVDDEPVILHTLQDILVEIGGYRVLCATSSPVALLLAAQQEHPPHLLMLDYLLFGSPVNGLELYDLLHERWPACPAIITSCNAPVEEVRTRGLTLLAKPFSLQSLLSAVAEVLAPVG